MKPANRIDKKFSSLKKQKKKALIFFMTAGDPGFAKNESLVYEFEKCGVDLVELGVPFSDPLADGPVIQASSQRSLAHGTTLKNILAFVRRLRKKSGLPILLMSYLNPIFHYGAKRFAVDAAKAGVDGLIVPDLPPEEDRQFRALVHKTGLKLVYLLAPTSTAKRRSAVAKASSGFIYYVSLTGVTGQRKRLPLDVAKNIRLLKKETKLPVCIGFGVSTPDQARALARESDGVIVGSSLVRALHEHRKLSAQAFCRKFVRPFARALGKGR